MAKKPCQPNEYALGSKQVQPDASYWMFCSQLHIVTLDELRGATDDDTGARYFPPYPDPCTTKGKEEIEQEFAEVLDLARRRDDPCSLVSDDASCGTTRPKPDNKPQGPIYPGVCEFSNERPKNFGCRAPISRLFNLTPPALGAVLVNRFPGEQVIRTGRGLARAVESETPGIFHRHALNYLISTRNWSPPFQALIWAALDVTIASALQAAWYYKWIGGETSQNPTVFRTLTARRERPSEYAKRIRNKQFTVLYDLPDELNPAYNLCPDGRINCDPNNAGNFAGTPRHPAYPSAHSTFSGAASEFLKFLFGNDPTPNFLLSFNAPGAQKPTTIGEELDNLAENIGLGRMWAGVHWRSDHEAGRKLGRVVACQVLQQLANMGAIDMKGKTVAFNLCPGTRPVFDQCDCTHTAAMCPDEKPQTEFSREILQARGEQLQRDCDQTKLRQKPCDAPSEPHKSLDINRSVQQGA